MRYVSSSQSATAECLIRVSHSVGNSPILDFGFLSVSRRIELFQDLTVVLVLFGALASFTLAPTFET